MDTLNSYSAVSDEAVCHSPSQGVTDGDAGPNTKRLRLLDDVATIPLKENQIKIVEFSPNREESNADASASSVLSGLGEALLKIREHILNTKQVDAKKSAKAMSLLLRLFERRWTLEPSAARDQLMEFWAREESLSPACFDAGAPCFPDLCKIVDIMHESIATMESSSAFRVASWRLSTSIRRGLASDDTLEFAKACKILKTKIEEIHDFQPSAETGLLSITEFSKSAESHKSERLAAIVVCLTDAFKQHKRDWAKQPLDEVIKAASERRMLFSGLYQEKLDFVTSQWTAYRRKRTASGGGELRTVRTAESTAHPLRQIQRGILR